MISAQKELSIHSEGVLFKSLCSYIIAHSQYHTTLVPVKQAEEGSLQFSQRGTRDKHIKLPLRFTPQCSPEHSGYEKDRNLRPGGSGLTNQESSQTFTLACYFG